MASRAHLLLQNVLVYSGFCHRAGELSTLRQRSVLISALVMLCKRAALVLQDMLLCTDLKRQLSRMDSISAQGTCHASCSLHQILIAEPQLMLAA